MKQTKFSITGKIKNVGHAMDGVKLFFQLESNSWIHLASAIIVVAAGFYFEFVAFEWITMTLAIAIVFFTETINTSIEQLADHVTPERHEMIKRVKDLASAAVLFAGIAAVVMGAIVFVPHIIDLFT